ncbi:MAG: hypothetical protein ACUVWN_17210 [bacterium]
MKKLYLVLVFLLLSSICAYSVDMALYVGMPNEGWYDPAKVKDDGKKIADTLKGIFKDIKQFDDKALKDLQTWAEKNLKDGELDIIWLNGCMPSVLYPNPNQKPNGSLAEEWLNNGNMFINVADWFAYCTYETGARGADNGAAGAENILNLPGIIRFGDNTALKVTADGKKFMPSLGDMVKTDRPIVGTAVKAPWEVAAVFAGTATGDMDPCVLHNTKTKGYMVFINQSVKANSVDRAQATIEFIKNWAVGTIALGTTPIEPTSRITTLWGEIKK